jgi:hypothetical protein
MHDALIAIDEDRNRRSAPRSVIRAALMTSGMASARATIAACDPTDPSSSTTPFSRRP